MKNIARFIVTLAVVALVAPALYGQATHVPAANQTEDAPHASADGGYSVFAVRNDTLAALAGTDGDYAVLQVDASGALYVTTSAGTSVPAKAEDAAHASADTGQFVLVIRNDALAALAGTDGDYAGLQVGAEGGLFVMGDQVEDTAAGDGDYALPVLAVRNDVLAALGGTDGDYTTLQVDPLGALFTHPASVGAITCGQTDVPGTGTAVQLGDNACPTGVQLTCETASTGDCFVRHSAGNGVTGGMAIPDGGTLFLPVSNSNLLFVDVSTNGDDVGWCCL